MELVQMKTSSLVLSLFEILLSCFFSSVHFLLRNLRMLAPSKWNGNLSMRSTRDLNDKPVLKVEARPSLEKLNNEEICMEELTIVMDRLGMASEKDEESLKNLNVNDFVALFDEEPSFLEIKEVFQVFDENKDGYIDAAELQKLLRGLCMKEGGYELEECRRMICAFDDNGDGLIDFTEFVAFMEKLQ